MESIVLCPFIEVFRLVVPRASSVGCLSIFIDDWVSQARQTQVVFSFAFSLSQDRVGQVDLDKVLVLFFCLCGGASLSRVLVCSQLVWMELKHNKSQFFTKYST